MVVCKLYYKVSLIFKNGRGVNMYEILERFLGKISNPGSLMPALDKLAEDMIKDEISGIRINVTSWKDKACFL